MNTEDASTTSGLDDFDNGTTWSSEVDFQYRLGPLPGGLNVGGLFVQPESCRAQQPIPVPTRRGARRAQSNQHVGRVLQHLQYLYIEERSKAPIDLLNGAPDQQGVGLFIRFGFADKETNPVEWAVSAGIGGRGLIPTRDNDTSGIGYYYNRVQKLRFSGILGLQNSAQGFECFYNIDITPACRVTLDLQVVERCKPGFKPRRLSDCAPPDF